MVWARGREWIVQPGTDDDGILNLRPFGGSEDDSIRILIPLEIEPVKSASFPPPSPEQAGSHDAALLLRDAATLKLRSGAGPFRSLGHVAIEPRAYQLVPMMMALKQKTVRLLIADDVGIGKTIEAGLIVRELLDRGEITRCAVLCPPHLVEQWMDELETRFNIHAEALTSSSASRLERMAPHGSLFEHYPFLVVSLDYIKSDRHRDNFLHMAPECIVIDEAHTCTIRGKGRQLRFELLKKLAGDDDRHMIFLTATPHGGDDEAFHNLLSLLDKDFLALRDLGGNRSKLRDRLARHFVQRRRKDIEEWRDQNFFPTRMTSEQTYKLTGEWENFFEEVRAYCASLAVKAEEGGKAAPLIWFVTLALLRCVSSSPAAAEKALTTRLEGLTEGSTEEEGEYEDESLLFDGNSVTFPSSDLEPAASLEVSDTVLLEKLIAQARSLAGSKGDPKLASLERQLRGLIKDNFHPVVFCRYIATAKYVGEHLARFFPGVAIDVVTGEIPSGERMERVLELSENPRRILVATDCLSEGINLQDCFNALVHYDLAWNPTRHEQREGRIDRFGQRSKEVRCTMLYGENNPIDGLILKVILRKAETIRKELGILVPMPDDNAKMQQALLKAAILKNITGAESSSHRQLTLEFEKEEVLWENAIEKMKVNRTIFAQHSLKPEDVLPEWQREQKALGSAEDVKRFVRNASGRLGAPLEKRPDGTFLLNVPYLPNSLRERLREYRIEGRCAIDFRNPPTDGTRHIHRSHPITKLLADDLLEGALADDPKKKTLVSRSAVVVTKDVLKLTRLYLLRLRYQLTAKRRGKNHVMVGEEMLTVAFEGVTSPEELPTDTTESLLDAVPSGNIAQPVPYLEEALAFWENIQEGRITELASARADALREDHMRVKDASRDGGTYEVRTCLPVDLLGMYVLLPDREAL